MKTNLIVTNYEIIVMNGSEYFSIKREHDQYGYEHCLEYIRKHPSDINEIFDYVKSYFQTANSDNKIEGQLHVVLPGDFDIKDEALLYKNTVLSKSFGRRILLSDEENQQKIVKFLSKLKDVDSRTVFESICDFIESNPSVIINEEGNLILWKHIDSNFNAIHKNPDGTRNKHIKGVPIEMPRHLVERNRDITCSTGLHVCSKEYLRHYDGDIVAKCEVDVRDIVSVPFDYENTKIRVCKYTPIEFFDSDNNVIEQCRLEEETSTGLDIETIKDIKGAKESTYTVNELITFANNYLKNRLYKIITLRNFQKGCKGFRNMPINQVYNFLKNNVSHAKFVKTDCALSNMEITFK